jgi:hypothetical protein
MLDCWLTPLIEDPTLDPKMRLVGGPRQCGKTTLARGILDRHHSQALLFNWDHRLFSNKLGGIPIIQLVREHGVLEAKDRDVVTVSASRFMTG